MPIRCRDERFAAAVTGGKNSIQFYSNARAALEAMHAPGMFWCAS